MQQRRKANYYGSVSKQQDTFPLIRYFDHNQTKKYLGGWLTCIQFERYYPDRGTSRRELHLGEWRANNWLQSLRITFLLVSSEDKHFAEDREFLSELMLQENKNVLTGDVTDKVDMARRYVEQCCQHWLTLVSGLTSGLLAETSLTSAAFKSTAERRKSSS